jgi:hypothetical protein
MLNDKVLQKKLQEYKTSYSMLGEPYPPKDHDHPIVKKLFTEEDILKIFSELKWMTTPNIVEWLEQKRKALPLQVQHQVKASTFVNKLLEELKRTG